MAGALIDSTKETMFRLQDLLGPNMMLSCWARFTRAAAFGMSLYSPLEHKYTTFDSRSKRVSVRFLHHASGSSLDVDSVSSHVTVSAI